ncbi:MAG: FkbM family methyltransferase [Arenicella sp.]|jgi:FkbM family methyltransferase
MIKKIFNKLGIGRTYTTSINNKVVKVQIEKGLGFPNFYDAEPWMTSVLAKFGSNDCRFLDVGVNVGQTLIKWKTLFPDSEYVGFEPNIACVDYVNKLITNNQFSKCKIQPYGIALSKEKVKLFIKGRDPGDSSATIIENFRETTDTKTVQVETTPLYELEPNEFDLIKIDVEGSELGVIESLFEKKISAVILCEILPVYSEENEDRLIRQKKIESILAANDYLIFRITKEGIAKFEGIQEIGIHSDLTNCDYLFLPSSKKDLISKSQ